MPVIPRAAVQAGAASTTTATSRTPGVPAGTQPGDLLLLAGCWSGGSTVTVTTPGGWTAGISQQTQTNDNFAVFWRTADGSGTDSPALTISSAVTYIATCEAFSGWNGQAPVFASVLGGAASTTITYPAITPKTGADLLVYLTGLRPSTATTQVTAVAPAGGTGGSVTSQIDGCTNVTGAAESEQALFTQQLTAATAVTQQTATVSTTVSGVCGAVIITPAALPLGNARRTGARTPALPPVRRYRQMLPVPAQLNPPYQFSEIVQRRETWPRAMVRHSRVTVVVPPQVNPPFLFTEIRQWRQPRGFFPRRGHQVTPVPAQQTPPVAVFVPQAQRHARVALAPKRGRVTVPVLTQGEAPPRQRQPVRPRPFLPRRRRPADVVPAQVTVAAPAWVQGHRSPFRAVALLRRRFRQLMPWPQATGPVLQNAVSHPAVTGQLAGNLTTGALAGSTVTEAAAVTPGVTGQAHGSGVTQQASSAPAVSGG